MRDFLVLIAVVAVLSVAYLITAYLVVMNTDECWLPWHDILPGKEYLCSLGR